MSSPDAGGIQSSGRCSTEAHILVCSNRLFCQCCNRLLIESSNSPHESFFPSFLPQFQSFFFSGSFREIYLQYCQILDPLLKNLACIEYDNDKPYKSNITHCLLFKSNSVLQKNKANISNNLPASNTFNCTVHVRIFCILEIYLHLVSWFEYLLYTFEHQSFPSCESLCPLECWYSFQISSNPIAFANLPHALIFWLHSRSKLYCSTVPDNLL